MRITDEDGYTYLGADKMILFTNKRLMTDQGTVLNGHAHELIKVANDAFKTRALTDEEIKLGQRFTSPSNTKGADS